MERENTKRRGRSTRGLKMSSRGSSSQPAGKWLQFSASSKPYLIVFVASTCGLTIEIVAGRILAPTIGVSLYTWTSIIGVVLAGISAGNYLGGLVADRFPSPTTLGLILLAAAVSSLSVLPLIEVVSDSFWTLPFLARIVFVTVTLFLLPSLILGMVTPVVIKLRLQDLTRTGNVVGNVYAISTVGSIFGTFITGFVLIQLIGTRETLLLVALVLFVMALGLGNLWRAKFPSLSLAGLFVTLGILSFAIGTLDSDCLRESNYSCIRVSDTTVEGGQRVKVLYLDRLLHSYVSLEDPTLLVHRYDKILADIEAHTTNRNPSPRILFIGGGGYSMPRYVETVYPQSTVEVIEIDPEVTNVAFEYLGLRPDTKIVTYNEDARMAVQKLPRSQYDLVIGDAFNDVSVPYHLTTREFNEQVGDLLKDEGIYAVNVVDKLHTGRFLRSYVNTLQHTFPYVYILWDNESWDTDRRETYVVAAAFEPLSPAALKDANTQAGRGSPVSRFMPEEVFSTWLNSQGNILLTDNYAPVDSMLGPIYLASGSLSRAERHYNAGVRLERQGQLQEALDEFDKAIRLDIHFARAYVNRGSLYSVLGEYQRAVQDLEEGIRLNPGYFLALYNRGTVYINLGLHQQAIEDLDEAILLNPQFAPAYINRGGVYTQLGQNQRAVESFDEAIRLDPQSPEAYFGRSLAHTALGQDTQAQVDFDRAVQLGVAPDFLRKEIDKIKEQR